MPLNQNKIISIILEQCQDIEERCRGYHNEVLNVVAEILILESLHRTNKLNIQQKINDKINATGLFLSNNISES